VSAYVSARDLRNHTRDVLRRVEGGEPVQITVNHRPVAELRPLAPRSSWVPGALIEELLRVAPADSALLEDLGPLREQVVDPR